MNYKKVKIEACIVTLNNLTVYEYFRNNKARTPNAYFAMGYGGQYIIVVPQYEMVVIFTSSMPNQTLLPLNFFKRTLFETLSLH
jgi:CubicO group peptidase (beta-lactamase class C family)